MNHASNLSEKIGSGEFIVTAELLPHASAGLSEVEDALHFLSNGLTAVNVADNPQGPVLSSLAGSLVLHRSGIEPVYQMVTRDRNRIALQSDLLGAAALGIRNILCLSGHHQSLTGSPESANVYDIDSIQFLSMVKKMRDEGVLLDGTKIKGPLSVFIGAVGNPNMTPMELNILRLRKKVEAGAQFIQTSSVFDTDTFSKWMEELQNEGILDQSAILAGILPLSSAHEAESLRKLYMDVSIPDSIIRRLQEAGDEESQKKEGLSICMKIIKTVKEIKGVGGIHIFSGSKESMVPEIIAQLEM